MARKQKVWTKHDIEIILQMKRAGYTYDQIASFFGFKSGTTLSHYCKTNDNLKQALVNGEIRSVSSVANRLWEKAMGIEYFEDTYEAIVPNKDEPESEALARYTDAGYIVNGMMYLKKRVKKLLAPDTFAMNSFLNNRSPENWKQNRDNDKTVEHKHTILIGGKPIAQIEASVTETVEEAEEADYVISEGGEGTN